MKAQTKIALRINDDNPNHHLSGEIKASHINLFYKNRSGSAGAVFLLHNNKGFPGKTFRN